MESAASLLIHTLTSDLPPRLPGHHPSQHHPDPDLCPALLPVLLTSEVIVIQRRHYHYPLSQMREVRSGKAKQLAQGHITVSFVPGYLIAEPTL